MRKREQHGEFSISVDNIRQISNTLYKPNSSLSMFSDCRYSPTDFKYYLYKPNCRYSPTDIQFSLYKPNSPYYVTVIKFSLFSTNNTVDILSQYQTLSVLYEPKCRYSPTDIKFFLFHTNQTIIVR